MASLGAFKDALEDLAAKLLSEYTDNLGRSKTPPAAKEFNDPVWKTIVLGPAEVALVDSPMIQRLRWIRQLGVAHLVYPGATHSRFEHSIGVVHQIQRLVNAINLHRVIPGGNAPIAKDMENLLRLTALCHDVGHGVMSHVSENALKSSSEFEDLALAFIDLPEVQLGRVKPSEIAAYFLLGSPAFTRLLETIRRIVGTYDLPDGRSSRADEESGCWVADLRSNPAAPRVDQRSI